MVKTNLQPNRGSIIPNIYGETYGGMYSRMIVVGNTAYNIFIVSGRGKQYSILYGTVAFTW